MTVWPTGVTRWPLVLTAGLWSCLLPAQTLRDPTVPPPLAGATGPAELAPSGLVLQPGQISVLQQEGNYYLVLGTRVFAQGQRVGQTTLERITETEVWLRENGSTQRIPVFAGVQRRAAMPAAAASSEAASVAADPSN